MTFPAFYAIIPATVRYCKKLEPSAKLLYGEITALAQKEGYCWASNKYFADLYEVDERSIQNWLKSLKAHAFIEIEIIKEGMQTSRKIWLSKEIKDMFATRRNLHAGTKISSGGGEKNFTHINTYSNTEEEPPPTSSPKKFPKNCYFPVPESLTMPNKWRWRRFFSGWSEEEFEYVWKEAFSPKTGDIKSPKPWMESVRRRYVSMRNEKREANKVIDSRKSLCEQLESDREKWRGDNVTVKEEYVEFTDGSYYSSVRFDVPEEEWNEKTGGLGSSQLESGVFS